MAVTGQGERLTSQRRHQSLHAIRSRISKSMLRPETAPMCSTASEKKAKQSLSFWNHFGTVSWPAEEEKDWSHTSEVLALRTTSCGRALTKLTTWLLPALIGFLTAASGSIIEKASEFLNSLLFGYCLGHVFDGANDCTSRWVAWSASPFSPELQPWNSYLRGWAAYAAVAASLAAFSAILVRLFAPTARGSGIPEVKTILGGFVMPDVLEFKTLVVKVVGLAFSVSSGMSLGKEGPLVHVACCWANFCSKLSPRYMENEGKRRELISTAAAAGVAVAFGAPVGGVLFSYEEVSTMFPQRTMIRAFFASVVAALTLLWFNPTGTGKLTMFETFVPEMPSIHEFPWFVALGIMGGLLGAIFVHLNIKISRARAPGTIFRRRVPIVVEVLLIAMFTGVTNYPLHFTRGMSPVTIRALFHTCADNTSARPDMMGLCDGAEPVMSYSLVLSLVMAAAVRFLQMIVTFGTGVPCGLFVPSLYTGACLGRCLGTFVTWLNAAAGLQSDIHPGVYAMVGAAAVLGGVCRVTISLVVIMYELTSALQLIVPFMLSVLTAKWVGDRFGHGIYDGCIRLRGYPYLHEPEDFTFGTRACDVMDEDIECVSVEPGTLGALLKRVRSTRYGGFPLIRSDADRTLLGYIDSHQVQLHIERLVASSVFTADMPVVFAKYSKRRPHRAVDLSKLVDEAVLRIVPETPLAQVHNIFRQLGVKMVLVARFAELAGIITKKSFVHHLESGSVGHMRDDPALFRNISTLSDCPESRVVEEAQAAPRKPKTMGEVMLRKKMVRLASRTEDGDPLKPAAMVQSRQGDEEMDLPVLVLGDVRQKQHRQASLTKMRESFLTALTTPAALADASTPISKIVSHEPKAKKSLRKWGNYETVSFPTEDAKDFWEHSSGVLSSGSRLEKLALSLVPWLIPALVGVLTACSGSLVEVAAEFLSGLRFGYCQSGALVSKAECGVAWQSWSALPGLGLATSTQGYVAYVVISVILATFSATLVAAFAPTARGSGIPEVKTILGGFAMAHVLEFKTLVVKVVGLALSVSSGMSLGKEGPLVHVACCWANLCSKLSMRYVENEAKRRELISTAAAAGVSVAFGTPLGGVLFSYEEVSTMFPQKTMIRAFFAAVVAALALAWCNPTGTGKLTMFETHYTQMQMPMLSEFPIFVLLGALGGVLGACFVHLNIRVSSARQEGTPFRQRVSVVLEVALIALVTAVTSYPSTLTRGLSSTTIRALFQSCHSVDQNFDMMGLCDGTEERLAYELLLSLSAAAALRFAQMSVTFGTGVPCGLFVPSLFTGACLGRGVGMLTHALNNQWHFAAGPIDPGVYAMVGAAAMLGGVCRVTISLVVIMFGLTGALQLVLPFMLAVLTAKFVGDILSDGIYDACIILRGYPYLHEPDDVCFKARACDIMDDELECLNAEPGLLGPLLDNLQATAFGGFPLVVSAADTKLLGYVHAEPLRKHLEATLTAGGPLGRDRPVNFKKYSKKRIAGALDVSRFVDETTMRLVPETPLAQVHNIFRQLGVKIVLVTRFGHLAGLITKKSFVDHLHDGSIGHVAMDPAVQRVSMWGKSALLDADGHVENREDTEQAASRRPSDSVRGGIDAPLLMS